MSNFLIDAINSIEDDVCELICERANAMLEQGAGMDELKAALEKAKMQKNHLREWIIGDAICQLENRMDIHKEVLHEEYLTARG